MRQLESGQREKAKATYASRGVHDSVHKEATTVGIAIRVTTKVEDVTAREVI